MQVTIVKMSFLATTYIIPGVQYEFATGAGSVPQEGNSNTQLPTDLLGIAKCILLQCCRDIGNLDPKALLVVERHFSGFKLQPEA